MSKKMKIVILVVVLVIAALTVTRCQLKATVNDKTVVDVEHVAQ